MRNRTIFGAIAAALFAIGLMMTHTTATANDGPNRITTRAACKRWTSGNAQKACIKCVKKGNDYFRKTGECRR